MASMFAHAVVAVTIGKVLQNKPLPRRFWVLMLVSTVLPDIDVIGFAFGIEYGDFLGHRGFTHSFTFAALWAGLVVAWFFDVQRVRIFIMLFLATASHGVLDAMTNGGLGIAFFSPFDMERYFMGFRPVHVSPIGIEAFFSEWGMRVIVSEIAWIGIPCIVLLLFKWLSVIVGRTLKNT